MSSHEMVLGMVADVIDFDVTPVTDAVKVDVFILYVRSPSVTD